MTDNDKTNDTSDTLPLAEVFGADSPASGAGPAEPGPAALNYAPAGLPATTRPAGPRIRWASVIWGAIFAASGWLTIWTLVSAERRADFTDWTVSLSPTGWIVAGVVVIGGLVLISGVTGALRRLSRGRGIR